VDFAEKKVTIDEDVRDGYDMNKDKECYFNNMKKIE
jgi:hypothetical protein